MKSLLIGLLALGSISVMATMQGEITDRTFIQTFNSAGGEYKMLRVEDKEKQNTCYVIILVGAVTGRGEQTNSKPTISCIKN